MNINKYNTNKYKKIIDMIFESKLPEVAYVITYFTFRD